MATHSSVLAWRIPGTGEPGGYLLWGRTESDTTEGLSSSSSEMYCCCLVAKLSLTLCDPMDYSLPVSSVHTISLQECFAAAAAKSLQLCPTLCDPTSSLLKLP